MLVYSAIVTVDGYIEDADGSFAFSEPSDEVHQYINDLLRPIRTHLYGRRLYETMAVWESPEFEDTEISRDFAYLWRAADKVVYSTTLDAPLTPRTRLERRFDPAAVAASVAALDHDALVGGANLAAQAFRAGLVDEVHLFVVPYVAGGGKPALPGPLRLDLVGERRFANGTVHCHYRVAGEPG